MPAPTTSDEFLELVRKSTVVDEKKLGPYVEQLRSTQSIPADPAQLAGMMIRAGLVTHFQAEQFLMGKWRRFTIGKHYKVLERLGIGGMGSVYLCEHMFMRRLVAVKVLPTAKAEDPASLERFYREARCVAALDHDNLVHAYDIGQDDKLHFLVLEYVDGASLQEIVKTSGPMDPIRAAHYHSQAAVGLQHAFECAALVHRDIKPGNILVDRQGTVKILDMGLARFFNDEDDILTKKYDENVLGTADYLAPEQALDSHNVDIRADIYSLGATFYFCLTGRTLFTEGSVAQKLIWHQTRQPKPISSFRSDVPPELLAVIDKMLAKEPAGRYSTPKEVVEALRPWTQTPIGPPSETEMPRISPAVAGTGSALSLARNGNGGPGSSARKTWEVPEQDQLVAPAVASAPAAIAAAPAPARPSAGSGPLKPPSLPKAPNIPRPAAAPPPIRATRQPATPQPVRTNGTAHAFPSTARPNDTPRPHPGKAVALPPARPPAAAVENRSTSKTAWRVLLLLGGALLGVALFLLIMLLFSGCWNVVTDTEKKGGSGQSGKGSPSAVVLVGKDGVPTLEKALNSARPGTLIKVMDPVIAEQFRLRSKVNKELKWDPPVIVESGLDGPVTWMAPTNAEPKDPLLVLEGIAGLRLRNFVFDGDNRVMDGIHMMGMSPDVALENLEFKGFTRTELQLFSANGYSGHDIQLLDLKVTIKEPRSTPAFAFLALKDIADVDHVEFLTVRGCRFHGPFKVPPIATKGIVGDLTWQENVWIGPDGDKPIPEPK
jgi:serine/threonine protein kinase